MNESGRLDTIISGSKEGRDASSWMFYTMILLVVSLPLSEFGMSVAQFLLFGFWIFEGADYTQGKYTSKANLIANSVLKNIIRKFRKAGTNYLLLVFLLLYFIHVVGLIYTTDLDYGLKDLRVKLPLLTFPVLLATSSPLSPRRLRVLLLFFSLSVIAGSLISFYIYLTQPISDPREISIFISHIRFGLIVSMSVFILIGFVRYNTFLWKYSRILCAAGVLWLLLFLFILKSSTGVFITIIVLMMLLVLSTVKHRRFLIPGISAVAIILLLSFAYIRNIYKDITVAEPIELKKNQYTDLGNPYTHDTATYGIEYGRYVGSYLAEEEMKSIWNVRSSLPYDGLDKKGQVLRYTLIRYLHSKGYRKDAEGVSQLTNKEISQIENGVANAEYLGKISPRSYIEQMLMGYMSYSNNSNPNASSLMQRFEYWKTSGYLIKHKPLFGYGVGDVKEAFDKAYEDTNSNLMPEFRHRSHNQYMAIAIALGLIGLLVFIIALFYPPIKLGKFGNYYYLVFFVIVFISFFTEDTLETQPGATFFGFFSALFLFGIRKKSDTDAAAV